MDKVKVGRSVSLYPMPMTLVGAMVGEYVVAAWNIGRRLKTREGLE